MKKEEKAVLVISFGTSYRETREKTIDRIEKQIREAVPEYKFYRAWTSRKIMEKLEKRDGEHIADIKEAMEQMAADGIREVVVQPTFILTGYESDRMEEEVRKYSGSFEKVIFGKPLLVSKEDKRSVIETLEKEYRPGADECLLFMGHGTEHAANVLYKELDELFEEMGLKDLYMGTVEGDFSLMYFLDKIGDKNYRRVRLAPFMIVAGDHAVNDMAGDEDDSWKSIIEKADYETKCFLKGLGEFEPVRKIFADHVREAVCICETKG
ncbi:MAG: sirohydrochlorin cobaltochelatase [Eubacteriales bacterium]|nr:sirohydrochlorin cobaltochelatase [Eubacteriales bacterium]